MCSCNGLLSLQFPGLLSAALLALSLGRLQLPLVICMLISLATKQVHLVGPIRYTSGQLQHLYEYWESVQLPLASCHLAACCIICMQMSFGTLSHQQVPRCRQPQLVYFVPLLFSLGLFILRFCTPLLWFSPALGLTFSHSQGEGLIKQAQKRRQLQLPLTLHGANMPGTQSARE